MPTRRNRDDEPDYSRCLIDQIPSSVRQHARCLFVSEERVRAKTAIDVPDGVAAKKRTDLFRNSSVIGFIGLAAQGWNDLRQLVAPDLLRSPFESIPIEQLVEGLAQSSFVG